MIHRRGKIPLPDQYLSGKWTEGQAFLIPSGLFALKGSRIHRELFAHAFNEFGRRVFPWLRIAFPEVC